MVVACYCGTTFHIDGDQGRCPYCGKLVSLVAPAGVDEQSEVSASVAQVARWRTERRQIIESPQYAFAMGHGCSMGPKSADERALLQRKRDLDALISEHETEA